MQYAINMFYWVRAVQMKVCLHPTGVLLVLSISDISVILGVIVNWNEDVLENVSFTLLWRI